MRMVGGGDGDDDDGEWRRRQAGTLPISLLPCNWLNACQPSAAMAPAALMCCI